MPTHIVQTEKWAQFKNSYGTKAVYAGGVYYTVHKIPFSGLNYAYCPRVIPSAIKWDELEESLKQNACVAVNFDVPNIITTDQNASQEEEILKNRCVKSPKTTFAENNILLDISSNEEDVLSNMHKKHRYNIGVAQRKGLITKNAETEKDFEDFYQLLTQTAVRQKYYTHSREYYLKVWQTLKPAGMCEIKTVYLENTPLASWMLFFHEDTMYYPYGGSSDKEKNLFASNLVGWEAILEGKRRNCKTFDMWGAAGEDTPQTDPWWGFTTFKIKFGGKFVKYIGSYDYVLNHEAYKIFNLANNLRWKILKVIR